MFDLRFEGYLVSQKAQKTQKDYRTRMLVLRSHGNHGDHRNWVAFGSKFKKIIFKTKAVGILSDDVFSFGRSVLKASFDFVEPLRDSA